MKRVLFLFLAMMLILCGCKTKEEIKIKTENLSFTCKVKYANEKYSFDVKTEKDGKMTCNAKYPDTLSGLTCSISGDTVIADYKGIKIEKNIDDIPYGNMISMFLKVMEDARNKNATEVEGNYQLSGRIRGTDYKLSVSPSGLPLGISFPHEKTDMIFTNLTLVK